MTHGILLQLPKGDPRIQVYKLFSEILEIGDGIFLRLIGDQLDFGMPFLRVRLSKPRDYAGLEISIPTHLVVLACSDSQDRKIGFIQAPE